MRHHAGEWRGTPSDLLAALEDAAAADGKIQRVPHGRVLTKGWPGAPHILTRRLNEVRSKLKELGVEVITGDKAQTRMIAISSSAEALQVVDKDQGGEDGQVFGDVFEWGDTPEQSAGGKVEAPSARWPAAARTRLAGIDIALNLETGMLLEGLTDDEIAALPWVTFGDDDEADDAWEVV
jgi:hypothetical protein